MRFFVQSVLVVLAAFASVRSVAQGAAQSNLPGSITVEARLTEVNALVRDAKGELIHGLTRDDFELLEDGKPQPIRYFDADSDLPLTLGLMVDTSTSMRLHSWDEHEASAAFLEKMLARPQDRAFLLRFDANMILLQPMTNDIWQLKSSLWMLMGPDTQPVSLHTTRKVAESTNPRDPGTMHAAGTSPTAAVTQLSGGTLLLDSIVSTSQKIISKEPGRRAIVVLTDGDDRGSRASLDDAIHAAQKAGVAVYTVLYLDRVAGGAGCSSAVEQVSPSAVTGRDAMQRLSQATGGRCLIIGKEMPVTHVFGLIEQDLRSEYRLGFKPKPALQADTTAASTAPELPPSVPTLMTRTSFRKTHPMSTASMPVAPTPLPVQADIPAAAADPVYHSIQLKTRNPQLTVQARSGYFDTPQ